MAGMGNRAGRRHQDGCSRPPTSCLPPTATAPQSFRPNSPAPWATRYPHGPAPAPRPTWRGPASEALLFYLHEQVEALKAQDPGVREDAPDAVHQLRVAARRMRSALATFGKLLDAGTAKPLRAELQWLAGTVGQARDTEVMRTRLTEMISAEPPELLLGPVAQQIEEHLGAIYREPAPRDWRRWRMAATSASSIPSIASSRSHP